MKKWIDFVEIKFQMNENLNDIARNLNWIEFELNWILIEFNLIPIQQLKISRHDLYMNKGLKTFEQS
jgi:hypothetical protein